MTDNNKLREALSAYAHEAWSGWMAYQYRVCKMESDGSVVIPYPLVNRWNRLRRTPYDKLTEEEKKSDQVEADKMIAIFENTPVMNDEEDYQPKTEAEIDEVLRQAGYDPEQVGRMGVKVALAAIEESPLYPKNQKIAELEQQVATLKKELETQRIGAISAIEVMQDKLAQAQALIKTQDFIAASVARIHNQTIDELFYVRKWAKAWKQAATGQYFGTLDEFKRDHYIKTMWGVYCNDSDVGLDRLEANMLNLLDCNAEDEDDLYDTPFVPPDPQDE